MVADAAFAEHAVYTGFVEHFAHCGINAREYNLDAFGMRGIDQNLEVVDAGGVDEGHLAHAQDSHAGLAAHGLTHEFVEFCGDSEKNGPSISYTSTPGFTSSTSWMVVSVPSAMSSCEE